MLIKPLRAAIEYSHALLKRRSDCDIKPTVLVEVSYRTKRRSSRRKDLDTIFPLETVGRPIVDDQVRIVAIQSQHQIQVPVTIQVADRRERTAQREVLPDGLTVTVEVEIEEIGLLRNPVKDEVLG